MKKLISCLLIVCLLMPVCSALGATLDLSYVRNSDLLSISVNSDKGVAFIDCDDAISVGKRSFTHIYEHPSLYSYIYSDIIVINYFGSNSYPIMRTWIEYEGTKPIYATSATFVIDGKNYTFSGLGNQNNMGTNDEGYYQTIMIKYGPDNMDFVLALLGYCSERFGAGDYDVSIQAVLHGTEDITIEMNAWALLDFNAIVVAFSEIGGIQFLDKAQDATTLKVH